MPMKMSAAKKKFAGKSRITGKQRVARTKNIEIARRSRKKGVKARPTSAKTADIKAKAIKQHLKKEKLVGKIQRQQKSVDRSLDSGKGDLKKKQAAVTASMGKLQKMGVPAVKGVYGRQSSSAATATPKSTGPKRKSLKRTARKYAALAHGERTLGRRMKRAGKGKAKKLNKAINKLHVKRNTVNKSFPGGGYKGKLEKYN